MTDEIRDAKLRRLATAFEFATKHFAILSVGIGVLGAAMAVIFIAAYLRVFDWRLIWIIEYSDVLKIGLIVVALLSGFSYWIWSGTRNAIDLHKHRGDPSWAWVHLTGALLWCISLGMFLYWDYRSPEPHYGLHLSLHFAILAVIGLAMLPMDVSRDFPNLTAPQIAWLFFLMVANISGIGSAFGYYTRDTSGFSHDVFLTREELHDVGLVMLTSHHVVLYTKEHTVIVIPSGDVIKLIQKSDQPAPKVTPSPPQSTPPTNNKPMPQ
jgi:hypothetical protein